MIKSILFDFDGVFTNDDYSIVLNALNKSSGLGLEEISKIIGAEERKYVTAKDTTQFLQDLIRKFNFPGTERELIDLLNQRGDSGMFNELPKFKNRGLTLSILSNQLAYRVPFVRNELETKFGLKNFVKVYFSPERGLQKPFVGVVEDATSSMDTSDKDIFPLVVKDMDTLGYKPKECLFIDDSKANIASAKKYGINGIVFKGIMPMEEELAKVYGIYLN